MVLQVSFEQSHTRSFTTPVTGAFRLTLTPVRGAVRVSGIHYIVLIDASGSMRGGKIETAKKAVKRLVEMLPEGNYVTVLAFGTAAFHVKELAVRRDPVRDRSEIIDAVEALFPEDGTPLYRALKRAIEIAEKSSDSGFIVLLTDGRPTDVTDLEKYAELKWPSNYKPYIIGVGPDYNEKLLALLADKGGGVFEHVSTASLERLVEVFEEAAAPEAYATNVEVVLEPITGSARFIGYDGLTVTIPVLKDEEIEFYGEVKIPASHHGDVALVVVSYEDPVTGERSVEKFSYKVTPAKSREEFIDGINREVYDYYLYRVYVEQARKLVLEGNIDAATKRLVEAEKLAEKTRRIDLVVQTKRMREVAEATKRLGGTESIEATKKLVSEATKRLRPS